MSLLADILSSKQRDLEALSAKPRSRLARAPRDVLAALRRTGPLRLVAEIKRKSPSAGPLSTRLSPAERAVAYARGGASMVSVLCDVPYFDGAWEHVTEVRAALGATAPGVLVLAKEFVLDPRQVGEARDRGADAVLLIARIVDAATLAVLVRSARDEGIEPLVEVVDEAELAAALAAGARIVGVNARDLDTLRMDTERAGRLLAAIPREVVSVHLSGLRGPADVAAVARSTADAALVGEALMRQDDPTALLSSMVQAAAPPR